VAANEEPAPDNRADQMQHDAAHRRFHPGAELHEVFAQDADLGGSEGRPRGSQTKFLVEHVRGGAQQPPQLIGEKAAATGTVDFQAMMQFFDPILDIAPGAVDGSGATRDISVVLMSFVFRASLLCECHRPFRFARPATAPTATTERELPLANTMGELDAGNRDGRVLERLEASHRRTASLDRPMI